MDRVTYEPLRTPPPNPPLDQDLRDNFPQGFLGRSAFPPSSWVTFFGLCSTLQQWCCKICTREASLLHAHAARLAAQVGAYLCLVLSNEPTRGCHL